ncbi:phage integrase SAM-like domain-containing protein [Spirosoma sp. 209]|uniref:phage integrase SAM-like domain-containing protein n=1 Tax=Spirosoma sp. 209 TaxID=1955701 RepID=UPI0011168B79|nr:phage integrase SAM-like domain-containing protein [Spirosoma sp. 209]
MSRIFWSRLSRQPMDLYFEFRPVRVTSAVRLSTADGQRPYNGYIYVRIKINNIFYGGYTTEIRTTRAAWDGRIAVRKSAEAKELINQIAAYEALLREAHDELSRQASQEQKLLDGEAVLNAARWLKINQDKADMAFAQAAGAPSPFELATFPRLYDEFMASRKRLIEPDGRKRQPDQIGPSTYETYPKRWALLFSYLQAIKRTRMPVLNVDAPFAYDLKDWLLDQHQSNGTRYSMATINKVLSFLKQLMEYAVQKRYVKENYVRDVSCRGGSPPNPKPLSERQLILLEECELPPMLRWVCDSWLVAGELCLHYSDYMELRTMRVVTTEKGNRFYTHERSKQTGRSLKQTVNITPRAERLIEKWGGVRGLYFRHSALFSKYLKRIAEVADLRDSDGKLIGLQFGQGRDTGLTSRTIAGANEVQLMMMAGWSSPRHARHYIDRATEVVEGFLEARPIAKNDQSPSERIPPDAA